MKDEIVQAALGGLLHDIGKFAQRAGHGLGQIWDAEAERDYRYQHALFSADAAADLLGDRFPQARQAIAYHHRPEHAAAGRAARLVAIADRLSSGERDHAEGAEPQQLLSIFARLFAEDDQPQGEGSYLPLQPLTMSQETLFSGPAAAANEVRRAYAALWDAFCKASGDAQEIEDGPTLVDQMLQWLLQYTWCIPSAAWHSIPDVSLYDHSRMTAALAVCLAPWDDDTLGALLQRRTPLDQQVALLVSGDISGIQEFIYTITPRGATPALRGRSFYLQMLNEAVAHYLLDVLGLPITNLVYAGGGRFYLLAPVGSEQALAEAQRTLSRVLLQHHGGDLYLALAHRSLAASEFSGNALSSAWSDINSRLRRVKERRFSELGSDLYPLLFEPWRDQGNRERECQVCHREHEQTSEHEGWRKCPMCRSFEALGDALRHARYLRVDQLTPQEPQDRAPAGQASDVLAALGMRIRLTRQAPLEVATSEARRSRIYALDDAALEGLRPGPRLSVGRKLLVNVTPLRYDAHLHDQRVATNDELAEASRGIKRLGILRMDVDDLGQVFSQGLGKSASLSRIASLSLAVSLYFEGYVEILAQAFNSRGADPAVYSIYSGGDDLFFVGAWDKMLSLAQKIHVHFARYTAQHPRMHLSGGLALVDAQYPIYRAAEEAREGEEAAKALPGKNAFCFLGRPLPWETLARAGDLVEKLDQLVAHGAPQGLLRLLMRGQEAHDAIANQRARDGADCTTMGTPQGYYGPWIPRLEYNLARMAERNRQIAEDLANIRVTLREDNYSSIQ